MARLLFEKTIRVHFGDADPEGILYFARFFQLAHNCLEDYWASTEHGWNYWFENAVFAVPLRHCEADFKRPLRAGDECLIRLSLEHIGDSSIEFSWELFSVASRLGASAHARAAAAPGQLIATVKTTHVFVDRHSFTKMRVPDLVRELEH